MTDALKPFLKSRGLTALLLVAVLQSAALFKMVYDRDRLLKVGREITLPVQPLDPRDMFRGDYVTLGYDFSALRKTKEAQPLSFDGLAAGSDAYVTLAQGTTGGWAITGVSPVYPASVAAGDVVLKGHVQSLWRAGDGSDEVVTLRYGIETYFVPEGAGRALETQVRDHKIEAVVAVGEDGTAGLKGLVVDGERHLEAPLL